MLRKFALTAHIAFSVGWLGAAVAYLVLAVTAMTSRDVQFVCGAYLSMELIGWFAIVPLSVAALLTGLVQSLGTEWGLFRHYWVVAKFLLTIGAGTILLLHMPAVSRIAGIAAEESLSDANFSALQHPTFVVHAGSGLLVLLATTTLSVYKPWGRTRFGQRKQHERISQQRHSATTRRNDSKREHDSFSTLISRSDPSVVSERASTTIPRWGRYVLLGIVMLILLFLILHGITGGH